MLSAHEQIERFWEVDADDPSGPEEHRRRGRPADLPFAVVAGSWVVVLLTLFGAMDEVLVVGSVTALYWAVWRWATAGPG